MANEQRFSGLAEVYKKYRPSYSKEAIDWLFTNYGLNEKSIVVDVGCGTGILSELFLQKGAIVYGVEPNDGMREAAVQALAQYPDFTAVKGNDCALNVANNTADLIVCAQAFHWFDVTKFKTECQRVLKSNGKVAIFYADFDPDSAMTEDLRKLNYNCTKDKEAAIKVRFAYSDKHLKRFFKNGIYKSLKFNNEFSYDFESFLGLMNSYSFNPREDDPVFPEYCKRIKEFFIKYQVNNTDIQVPYYLEIYVNEGAFNITENK